MRPDFNTTGRCVEYSCLHGWKDGAVCHGQEVTSKRIEADPGKYYLVISTFLPFPLLDKHLNEEKPW